MKILQNCLCWWLHNLVNILKIIELYTLNEWVLLELYYNMTIELSIYHLIIYVIKSVDRKKKKKKQVKGNETILSKMGSHFSEPNGLSTVSCQLFSLFLNYLLGSFDEIMI